MYIVEFLGENVFTFHRDSNRSIEMQFCKKDPDNQRRICREKLFGSVQNQMFAVRSLDQLGHVRLSNQYK